MKRVLVTFTILALCLQGAWALADGPALIKGPGSEIASSCPPPPPQQLTLDPDDECYADGETVTVEIWMRNITHHIVGGQFFLRYDNTKLDFVSAVPGEAPFTWEMYEVVNETAGAIDYSVYALPGNPGVSGTKKMAVLTFTALTRICTEEDLISWLPHGPPSRLSNNQGGAVYPDLIDMDVIDDEAPVLTGCPTAEITVECDAVPLPPTVTASDNCDDDVPVVYEQVRTDGPCPDTYTLTRTWTATDDCGNAASCQQIIHVQDTTDPVLAGCPAPEITVECDAVPPPPTVTATDNCDDAVPVVYVQVRTDGPCPDTYTLTRTWTATDDCGNAASCQQIIHVQDMTDPVLAGCPAPEITVECDAVPPPPTVTATDNCDDAVPVVYVQVRTDGPCPDTYTLTRTWTATDDCGNAASCQQIIHVQDTTDPVLAGCPAPEITVECDAVPAAATVTATDNCDDAVPVIYVQVRTDGPCPDTYTLTRTWTATDDCGNAASCQQIIHVQDTTDPVLAGCPAPEITVECDAVPAAATVTATDNCDDAVPVVYVQVRTDGPCPDTYTLTRTWTATDDCGNAASCQQIIHVQDTTDPVLAGCPAPEITVECDAVPPPPTVTATDNCDDAVPVVYEQVRTDGPCPDTYTLTRTWTATDDCGNTASCQQIIHVQDTTRPVITCPPNIIVNADAGLCTAVVDPGTATATDNCDDSPTITCERDDDLPLDAPYPHGTTTITCKATDDCGNFRSCCYTVKVNHFNEMLVNVQLSPTMVAGPINRCITFELWECSSGAVPDATVNQVLSFTNGTASNALVLVPCGSYTCITARDKRHTLRRTDEAFGIVGTQYVADFTGAPAAGGDWLIGGNLNDDYWIDILDFGVLNWKWNVSYGSGNTTCSTSSPHADINGSGIVDQDDFEFISNNFLQGYEPNCCALPGFRSGEGSEGPIAAISVADLQQRGLGHLAVGDLNGDGMLDQADIAAFLMGARPQPQPDLEEVEAIELLRPTTNQLPVPGRR